MTTKLYLTFSETRGPNSEEFEWVVSDMPLAQRWLSELIESVRDTEKNREQNFFGWATQTSDQANLAHKLNLAIEKINGHFGKRYQIRERAETGMSQDTLNKLHHHFEILIGQVWSPSVYIKDLPPDVHASVRDLNEIVHEYEASERAKKSLELGERVVCGFQFQLTPLTRKELSIEDLKTFNYENEPGNIVSNYCQLGKTWTEVCVDHDQHIEKENIAPLRYYSSSFLCNFHWFTPSKSNALLSRVKGYIEEKRNVCGWDVDADDPRNALGHATYATLAENSPLLRLSDEELSGFFTEFANISKIRIRSGGMEITRNF